MFGTYEAGGDELIAHEGSVGPCVVVDAEDDKDVSSCGGGRGGVVAVARLEPFCGHKGVYCWRKEYKYRPRE